MDRRKLKQEYEMLPEEKVWVKGLLMYLLACGLVAAFTLGLAVGALL